MLRQKCTGNQIALTNFLDGKAKIFVIEIFTLNPTQLLPFQWIS